MISCSYVTLAKLDARRPSHRQAGSYFFLSHLFYKPLFNYQAVFALIAQKISGALAAASG
jgi:hypothetical protein